MTSTNGNGGGKHRKPENDQPTDRFPALQEALETATSPAWPLTDPDD